MAYQYVGEALYHLPPRFTPTQRLLLVAIGESIPYPRSRGDISLRALGQAAGGLSRRALRQALAGLDAELSIRVPLGIDSRGHPLYAVPGRTCTFQWPDLAAPADCVCEPCAAGRRSTTEGGVVRPPRNGGGNAGSEVDAGQPPGGCAESETDAGQPPTRTGVSEAHTPDHGSAPADAASAGRAEALAALRAKLPRGRPFSRWPTNQPSAEPNPLFDPAIWAATLTVDGAA